MFCFLQEEVMASHITRRLALIGACYATALCLVPFIAFAAERFSAVGLANETQTNPTICYRWGVEEWQKVRLAPGARQWFSWKFSRPDKYRPPDFHIVLDSDSSALEYEARKLRGFIAGETNFDVGRQYAFRLGSASRRFIEFWDISPLGGPSSSSQGKRID